MSVPHPKQSPMITIDLTMDDDGASTAGDPSHNETSLIKIETEPQEIHEITEQLDPLHEFEFEPSSMDGHEPVSHEESFESDLVTMLAEFNANSHAERAPSSDHEYEEALHAVEQKRVEIATKSSIGESVESNSIELKILENTLYQAKKQKQKLRDYEMQQAEDHAMFYPEEDDNDIDVHTIHAPTRQEAMGFATGLEEQVEISDDDTSDRDPRQQSFKGKHSSGKNASRKSDKRAPATRGKSRVQKRTSRTARRGEPHTPTGIVNIGSLMRNNVVEDARRNQGAGSQPTFEGKTNKLAALNALIASIPKEHQDTGKGMKTELNRACKQFKWRGIGSMRSDGHSGWKLKGMASSLKNFQLQSTAWGVARESGIVPPFGGILADTMGYGKTVQMITIMVENQPRANARNRTTLIVMPSSIVAQWIEEIAKHLEDRVMEDVLVYKSGSRVISNDICKTLNQHRVVITTYHEVMQNYPKCDPPVHLVTEKAKDEWWEKHFHENKGPLLSMPFHRVILDEAQTIKNHESRTSKACRLLTSKYKWALTGTPLSNCLEELYPYFDFLGVEGAASYAQFKQNYAKRNDKSTGRLDAILRKVMMRRTGADRLFGAPLVTLPALEYETIKVSFNPVERAIYAVVRQRFISRINDWSAAGNINRLSRNIFVMLTRLRQMCAHVLMVTSTIRDLLEAEDIEKIWRTIERYSQATTNSPGMRTAVVLKKLIREARDEHHELQVAPAESAQGTENGGTIDLTIDDTAFDFRSLFYKLQHDGTWDKVRQRSRCSSCNDVAQSPKLSVPCGHLYCDQCLQLLLDSAQQASLDSAECLSCHGDVTDAADLTAMERIAEEAGEPPQFRMSPTANAAPKKGKAKKDEDLAWLNIPGVENLSTKCQAVIATMDEWIKNDPEGKIVVFTLFIPMIKVLAKACSRRGWGYQEYTGQIRPEIRNKALQKWKDPEEGHRVLLMSLRAGGLGLNLVEGSYVVIVDPWWNEAAEDQAFSRVYRIGQRKDCTVRRFVIADAVDTQLMLHLQRLKAQECDRVIDGRSNQELTVPDLLKLFGPTRRDPETNEIIVENGNEEDGIDDFVLAHDQSPVGDSDVEDTMPAPARPRD